MTMTLAMIVITTTTVGVTTATAMIAEFGLLLLGNVMLCSTVVSSPAAVIKPKHPWLVCCVKIKPTYLAFL